MPLAPSLPTAHHALPPPLPARQIWYTRVVVNGLLMVLNAFVMVSLVAMSYAAPQLLDPQINRANQECASPAGLARFPPARPSPLPPACAQT
jgi:hypothetical protein